jgi:hypothetical protein
MDVRGQRECRGCGERWSYYETGSVRCPACDSARSRGVGERAVHTDTDPELDLNDARERAGDDGEGAADYREAARLARSAAREYLAGKGFVHGGELLALDPDYRRAAELRYVADEVERGLEFSDATIERFLALLGDDPEGAGRPPEALWGAHGLAAADTADAYAGELRTWLADADPGIDPRPALGRLREHVNRVEALGGEVEPADADALVAAARDIGRACREDDPAALAAAEETLGALA